MSNAPSAGAPNTQQQNGASSTVDTPGVSSGDSERTAPGQPASAERRSEVSAYVAMLRRIAMIIAKARDDGLALKVPNSQISHEMGIAHEFRDQSEYNRYVRWYWATRKNAINDTAAFPLGHSLDDALDSSGSTSTSLPTLPDHLNPTKVADIKAIWNEVHKLRKLELVQKTQQPHLELLKQHWQAHELHLESLPFVDKVSSASTPAVREQDLKALERHLKQMEAHGLYTVCMVADTVTNRSCGTIYSSSKAREAWRVFGLADDVLKRLGDHFTYAVTLFLQKAQAERERLSAAVKVPGTSGSQAKQGFQEVFSTWLRHEFGRCQDALEAAGVDKALRESDWLDGKAVSWITLLADLRERSLRITWPATFWEHGQVVLPDSKGVTAVSTENYKVAKGFQRAARWHTELQAELRVSMAEQLLRMEVVDSEDDSMMMMG